MTDKEPGFPAGKRLTQPHAPEPEAWGEEDRPVVNDPEAGKPLPKGVDGFSAGKGRGRTKE